MFTNDVMWFNEFGVNQCFSPNLTVWHIYFSLTNLIPTFKTHDIICDHPHISKFTLSRSKEKLTPH